MPVHKYPGRQSLIDTIELLMRSGPLFQLWEDERLRDEVISLNEHWLPASSWLENRTLRLVDFEEDAPERGLLNIALSLDPRGFFDSHRWPDAEEGRRAYDCLHSRCSSEWNARAAEVLDKTSLERRISLPPNPDSIITRSLKRKGKS